MVLVANLEINRCSLKLFGSKLVPNNSKNNFLQGYTHSSTVKCKVANQLCLLSLMRMQLLTMPLEGLDPFITTKCANNHTLRYHPILTPLMFRVPGSHQSLGKRKRDNVMRYDSRVLTL